MHRKLFHNYNFKGKIKKSKNKNLYLYIIIANWEVMIKLLEYKLLTKEKHINKLKWAILNHKKYKSMRHFSNLNNRFSSQDIMKEKNNSSNTWHWLKDRQKEGFIDFIKTENNLSYWELTDKGKRIKQTLKNL